MYIVTSSPVPIFILKLRERSRNFNIKIRPGDEAMYIVAYIFIQGDVQSNIGGLKGKGVGKGVSGASAFFTVSFPVSRTFAAAGGLYHRYAPVM